MFAGDGIRGAFIEGVSDQVDTYVTMKLLDDPSLDVDALLEEFFTLIMERPPDRLKQFYLCVEETSPIRPITQRTFRRTARRILPDGEEIAWEYLGTEERMAKLGKLMDEAAQLAAGDVEKQRVDLFRKSDLGPHG